MPIQPGSPVVMAFAVLLYLVFVNGLTLLLFHVDALRAEAGKRRVPERKLHLLAIFGGSLAAKLLERSDDRAPRSVAFHSTLNLVVAAQIACMAILQTPKGQDMVLNLGASTIQIANVLVHQTAPGHAG